MIIFIILGGVVLLAIGIIGFLFFLLQKEGSEEKEVVALGGSLGELKKSSAPVPALKDVLPSKESQETAKIKEAAEKEFTYQKKVAELEVELKTISEKAKEQSKEALETVEQLRKENEQLKNEQENRLLSANQSLASAQGMIDTMRQEQGSLQARLTESQQHAQKLQEECIAIKHQMTEEVLHVKTETAKLVVENQRLQSSVETISTAAVSKSQDELNSLKEANQKMHEELTVVKTEKAKLVLENQELQSSLEKLSPDMIQKLQEENTALKAENQKIGHELFERREQIAQELHNEIAALKEENTALKNSGGDISAAQEKIKELEGQLAAKTEEMQWELTKARAQVTSFERACENYQLQLKEMMDQKAALDVKSNENPSEGS